MKIQTRNGVFETNSSSTHSISIIQDNANNNYPDNITFDSGEFGWGHELYTDTQAKANYLWEAIKSMRDNEDIQKYISAVINILSRNNIIADFKYRFPVEQKNEWNGNTYSYYIYVDIDGNEDGGYIDHGYELEIFVKDITTDEDKLLNFLFNDKSYITTGNDNTEFYLESPDYGDSWEYYKGN